MMLTSFSSFVFSNPSVSSTSKTPRLRGPKLARKALNGTTRDYQGIRGGLLRSILDGRNAFPFWVV